MTERTFGLNPVLMDWAKRFVLHVATGVLAVAMHYALMALLLKGGFTPVVASSIGFCAGALTRFLTAHYHVFEPTGSVKVTIPKFLLALAAQGVMNSLLLTALMNAGMAVWWGQVTTTVLMTFANYLAYRLWVFR
ncbi:MAG: GtrA family protein [Betaproteobacteria bacterium]|nr:GtrA family protein [Betaproteobacteria bacterium]